MIDNTSMSTEDQNGRLLYCGDYVYSADNYRGAYIMGEILDISGDGICVIEDLDGEIFEVEGKYLIYDDQ